MRAQKMRTYHPTVLDFAVIGIAPALITVALWSLIVAFLTVFYHGGYEVRLLWALCLFAMGVVCTSRIGMAQGTVRALCYAMLLYGVGVAMMSKFFPYMHLLVQSAILLGIWSVAFLLVYDSTWMPDENEDRDGGFLQQVKRRRYITKLKLGLARKEDDPDRPNSTLASVDPQEELNKKIPHKPGLGIIWFSLVVLPILGMMQGVLPKDQGGLRQTILECTVVYLLAALGLLMSTSFIGLRRYLRFRQLDMPTVIVKRWFGFGAVLIFSLVILTLVIPRPAAENTLAQLPGVQFEFASKQEKTAEEQRPKASQWSVGKFEAGHDTEKADRAITDSNAKRVGNQAQSGAKGEPGRESGKGRGQGSSSKSDSSSGSDNSSKSGSSSGSDNSSKSNGTTQSRSRSGEVKSENSAKSSLSPSSSTQQASSTKNPQETKTEDLASSQHSDKMSEKVPNPEKGKSSSNSWSIPRIHFSGGWLKWVVYMIVFGGIVYWSVRHWVTICHGFREFWKSCVDFWRSLFGKKPSEKGDEGLPEGLEALLAIPQRRLSEFSDPFLGGAVRSWTPSKLLAESFGALEAWGRENGMSREENETVREYADRVAGVDLQLGVEAIFLANLYGRTIYFPSVPPSNEQLGELRRFWGMVLR